MPLTAQHAQAGVLDATVDPLGEDMPWEAIHRARPRAPLTCRECGHGLHAKLSPRGLRFFAHNRAAPACSLVGETMAHRLLKLQLASAIREAGWYAELEVTGDGWRADVLATSPDGARRMAWEAQLAQITIDELQERTTRMRASGVPVCWVTDHDRPWIGAVPAIQIALPTDPGSADAQIIDGAAVFRESWCPHRRCENDGGAPGPCPGHGWWGVVPDAVNLETFVAGVLGGTIRLHQVAVRQYLRLPTAARIVWTTRQHVI